MFQMYEIVQTIRRITEIRETNYILQIKFKIKDIDLLGFILKSKICAVRESFFM